MKKKDGKDIKNGKNSKNGKQEKRGNYIVPIVLFTVLFLLLGKSMLDYSKSLKRNLYKDGVEKLGEISNQNVMVLNKQIAGQLDSLTEIAARIAVPTNWDADYTMFTLNKVMERYPFKSMSVIFPDGTAYLTSGEMYQVSESDMEKVAPAFEGKNVVSSPSRDAFDGSLIISLEVPMYKGDDIKALLVASYETKTLQDMLNVSFFSGRGYSYIVRSNGDIVADSTFPTSFKNTENVFKSMIEANPENAAVADEMLKNMQLNEDGYVIFNNKVDKYMYYSSVGINDWYLLSVIPATVIDSTKNSIMFATYLLCSIICVIFAIIIIYFTKIERDKRHDLQDILYVDPVTNGYTFQKFVKEAKETLKKDDGRKAALVVLDIEKFKMINEMFGYDEGDKVLKYIWSILEKWVENKEIYCRRIADKFCILAFYYDEEQLVKRLKDLSNEIMSDRTERRNGFVLRPVIGVYRIIDRELDIPSMQNNAAIARNEVKTASMTNKIGFYDEEYKANMLRNKILEDKLVTALEKKEFEVFYQPKYNAATKELSGAEALIRWKKPDGSYVPPYQFIPAAEKNGFVVNLDKYVFKRVCEDQRERLDFGKKIVPVSVNLSRQHLYNPAFIEEYKRIIDRSGVPIDMVELEITESAMFENQDEFKTILDNLHETGFRILMDDFGTGYSSLMMLKSIPIDVMKLDKSFVDDYNNEKGEKIIACVTQLAKALKIEVTAEGVETEEQYNFMTDLGCDMIQGYYFAKPMPRIEFDKLLLNA